MNNNDENNELIEYSSGNKIYPSYTEYNFFQTNNIDIRPPKKKSKFPIVLLILLILIVGILIYLTFFTDKLNFIKSDDNYSEFDPNKGKIESNSNIESNKVSDNKSNVSKNITSIIITPSAPSVVVGSKVTLKTTITPSDASDKSITWKSSNTKIATVNSKGVVTGVKAGTTTIIATSKNGKKASVKVIVTNKLVPVTGLSLSSSTGKVYEGKTLTIRANISPSDATNKEVNYKSSNVSVATISSNGIIKGISPGTATITVTTKDGNFKKNYTITVLEADVQSISFDAALDSYGGYTVRLGTKYKPTIIYTPSTAINGLDITWSVRDEGKITLDKDGTITPIKEGMTYVIATTSNGKTAKLKIFIRLTPTDYNIKFAKVNDDQCIFKLINIKNNVEMIDFKYIKYNSKVYYSSDYQSIPCSNIDTTITTGSWSSSSGIGYNSSIVYTGF